MTTISSTAQRAGMTTATRATTLAGVSGERKRAGCRVAPLAVVRHVASGLAFPGAATLTQAHVVKTPRAFYFAARIVPPGKHASVGTGVWVMKTLSPAAVVVAVDKTAAAYSDWQRADLPLSALTRARALRVRQCLG